MEIVATNVVASRPPERRPTATPTARAKSAVLVNDPTLYVDYLQNCQTPDLGLRLGVDFTFAWQ